MNYRLIRNVRVKGRFLDLGLLVACIVLILFFHIFYPSMLGEALSRIALPFWNTERFVASKITGVFSYVSSKQALIAENERLSQELDGANKLLLDRELTLEENRLLKEQFGRTSTRALRLIASVLTTPPRSPYDSAVIDLGSADGIEVGDRALSGSVVLGAVSKVYRHTSLVEFFSTAGRKTGVSILHAGSAIPAEASGEGGGGWSVTLPKEADVSVGDAVVLAGMNPLLFARIEAIESSDTDSFQEIRFRNPVSISSLRFLELERVVREGE
ncbi:MAG: rod shape-determining protein MreC [Candidatus Taylorbacteria bacterium]|nr:rod shape-determining protein MreC [Candidatus Taylorbacteria bacterium]